jgi:hypothetical protein
MVQWSFDRTFSLGIHVDPIRRPCGSDGLTYGPYVDVHLGPLAVSVGNHPARAWNHSLMRPELQRGERSSMPNPGLSGLQIVFESDSQTVLDGNGFYVNAVCPTGKKVIGGGGAVMVLRSGNSGDPVEDSPGVLALSAPWVEEDPVVQGWSAFGHAGTHHEVELRVDAYAVCVDE